MNSLEVKFEKAILADLNSAALRHLVPFAQFEKREKHQWRSVTFRIY